MRTFVFAYNRFADMTTSLMLTEAGIDHTVLCHTEEQKQQFIEHGTAQEKDLLVTNNERGLAYQRNYALDLVENGEWVVFLVDDFKEITEYSDYDKLKVAALPITMKNTSYFAKKFNKQVGMKTLYKRITNNIKKAEEKGINLVGFASNGNPLFRRKHYQYWGLVDGRAWAIKKTKLKFDLNVQLIDDICWSVLNLKYFGAVLIDNWVRPECLRYTKDASFGSIEQRLFQKMIEADYLVTTYPEYVMIAKKPNWADGSHVKIKPRKR